MAYYIDVERGGDDGGSVKRPYDGPLTPGMTVYKFVDGEGGRDSDYVPLVVNQNGQPVERELRYTKGGEVLEAKNVNTGEWERAVVTSDGTQMPISEAQSSGQQYTMAGGYNPGSGSLLKSTVFGEGGDPGLLKMAASFAGAYGANSLINGALSAGTASAGSLSGGAPEIVSSAGEVAGDALVGGAEGALGGGGAAGAEAIGSGFAGAGATGANAALGLGSGSMAGSIGTVASSGSALSRVINGTATAEDYLSLGGKVAPALLGAYASNEQSNDQKELAAKYEAFGAPSRARYEASMTPGFDPTTIPGYAGALDSTSKAVMSRLSTQGNPFGNPGGLIEANKAIVNGTALPAVQDYQRQNAATGGISTFNTAAPSAAAGAINSNAGVYNAIGYGIDQVTQPDDNNLDAILKRIAGKSTSAAGLA